MSVYKHIMYPFRRISYSKQNQVIEKAKAYYGFYCKECYRHVILKGNITINLSSIENPSDNLVDFYGAFVFECPECHKINIWTDWPLDPNIAPMIATLNRKGYITTESCEGHNFNRVDDLAFPYIEFMYPGQAKVLKYIPLQGPWKLNTEEPDRFLIYCPDNSVGLRERMAHLRFWVNYLPPCYKEEFTIDDLTEDQLIRLKRANMPKELPEIDKGDGTYTDRESYLKIPPLESVDSPIEPEVVPDNIRKAMVKDNVELSYDGPDGRMKFLAMKQRKKDIKKLVKGFSEDDIDLEKIPDDMLIPIKIPNPYDGVEAARARAWARKQEELEEWRKTRRLGKEKFKDHQKEVRARLDRRAAGLPEVPDVLKPKSTKGDPNLPYNGKKNSPRTFIPKEIRDAVPHSLSKNQRKKKKYNPKGPRNYTRKRNS